MPGRTEDSARQHLARGRALHAEGRFEEAQGELEAARDAAPEAAEVHAALGALLLDADDLSGARAALERALRLGVPDPAVLRALAETCCRLGAYGDAAEFFHQAACAAGPDASAALPLRLNAAICRFRAGRIDDAEYELVGLAGERPTDSGIALALAQVAAHRPGGHQRARQLLEEVLQREPQHLLARYDLGLLLTRTKGDDPAMRGAAIEQLERLMEAPGFPELLPDAHMAHFALATCYDDEPGGYRRAAEEYRATLARRPDFAPALCNLGIILGHHGERSQALALFARALRIDPRCEPAADHLARLCMEAEDPEAVQGLCEALDLPVERAEAAETVLRAVEGRAHADGQAALCEAIHRIKNRAGVLAGRVKSLEQVDACAEEGAIPDVLELAGMIFDDLNGLLGMLRPVETSAEVIDAATVLRRMAGVIRTWAPPGIDVTFEPPRASLPIRVDRERIRDLLTHLARNAISAMPEGGSLHLSCEGGSQGSGWVALKVRDTGEGIPPARVEEVLKPGVSLRPGGSGLGLWICGRIARAHGGSLRLESVEGEGTTAALELPPPEHPSLTSRSLRLRRPLMGLRPPAALELTAEHTPAPRLSEEGGGLE